MKIFCLKIGKKNVFNNAETLNSKSHCILASPLFFVIPFLKIFQIICLSVSLLRINNDPIVFFI